MIRKLSKALYLAVALGAAGAVHAAYPDHPIRYVLHVSPGGATDVMARKLGNIMQKQLNVPVVVENRPGGRGAAEMAEITRARPDGYTVAAVTSSHLAEFHLTLKKYNVDSVTWLARLVSEPYLFVVRANSPVHSMKELASTIKAKPGMVVSGFQKGSGANIAWEMFLESAKLPSASTNWVPYNSVGAGVTAVLGGHGDVTVAYYGLVKDQVAAGNLRVIGVLAPKRLAELPKVPTLAEEGFNAPAEWYQWRGIVAPKGMPAPVQAKLVASLRAAVDSPEFKEYMQNQTLVYDFADTPEFSRFVHEQDVLTQSWLKRLGFTK